MKTSQSVSLREDHDRGSRPCQLSGALARGSQSGEVLIETWAPPPDSSMPTRLSKGLRRIDARSGPVVIIAVEIRVKSNPSLTDGSPDRDR